MTRDDRGMQVDPQQVPATLMQPATDAGQPAAPPVAAAAADEVTQRLQHLRGMLADLDSYVQRRAEDLAEPMIRDAEARARLAITEATGETQRQRELVEELRKRLAAADRMREETRRIRDQLAEALGRHRSTPMESLVAEIVTRLKESGSA